MSAKQRRRPFNYLVSYDFILKDGRAGNGSIVSDINCCVMYHRVYTKLYDWLRDSATDLDFKTMTISSIQRLN